MRKIVDYQIVSGFDTFIERVVKDSIKEGWYPVGSIMAYKDYPRTVFFQAMVKYEEEDEKTRDYPFTSGYAVPIVKKNEEEKPNFKMSVPGAKFKVGDKVRIIHFPTYIYTIKQIICSYSKEKEYLISDNENEGKMNIGQTIQYWERETIHQQRPLYSTICLTISSLTISNLFTARFTCYYTFKKKTIVKRIIVM